MNMRHVVGRNDTPVFVKLTGAQVKSSLSKREGSLILMEGISLPSNKASITYDL